MSEVTEVLGISSKLKYIAVIGLLVITVGILLADRFFPNDKIDNSTVTQMNQITAKMQDIGDKLDANIVLQNKINQQLVTLLQSRGKTRDDNYQELLKLYGNGGSNPANGVQQQSNHISSKN